MHGPGPLHKLSLDTWLVGNIVEHIQLGGIFRSHEKYAKEYGPIFVARNVHKPIVMVESPDLARKVPQPSPCISPLSTCLNPNPLPFAASLTQQALPGLTIP